MIVLISLTVTIHSITVCVMHTLVPDIKCNPDTLTYVMNFCDVRIYKYVYVHVYTHAHPYTDTHTHTHTQNNKTEVLSPFSTRAL